eukprot:973572-Karenia_brevis.AAC.1
MAVSWRNGYLHLQAHQHPPLMRHHLGPPVPKGRGQQLMVLQNGYCYHACTSGHNLILEIRRPKREPRPSKHQGSA